MSKTVAVPVELLEELIEQHITAKGFTNETARKAQAILSAPVVDEPKRRTFFSPGQDKHKCENCGHFVAYHEFGMCPRSCSVAYAANTIPNTGSAGQSIARCSQSHSEAGWCGTDDCYRRNR